MHQISTVKNLLIIILICCLGDCFAQKIIGRKNKLTSNVTERFETVIETNKQVKQGMYHALFNKKIVLASGKYVDDKKVGIWHYFDRDGKLMQNYDYNNNKLLYEAPEGLPSPLSYNIDYIITDKDVAVPPIRPGGRYFGYVPYLMIYKMPTGMSYEELDDYIVILDLLVSPLGRLADMVVHIQRNGTLVDYMSYNVNIDLLTTEDKTFIPAMLNKTPVASQIHLMCELNRAGAIDIAYLTPQKTTAE